MGTILQLEPGYTYLWTIKLDDPEAGGSARDDGTIGVAEEYLELIHRNDVKIVPQLDGWLKRVAK
jgi:hypothetical protein